MHENLKQIIANITAENLTIIDYAVKYTKFQRLMKEWIADPNYIRFYKRVYLLCKLV